MKFNLLWDNNLEAVSALEESVFDDLDIYSLFNLCIDYNYSFLMPVIKQIPPFPTIPHRQDIMTDFLNDEKFVFETLKEHLDILIASYNKYVNSKHIFYKHVNFLVFIETYINKFEEISLIINNFEFISAELKKFKKFINEEVTSESFQELKTDCIIALNHFEKMQHFATYGEAKAIRVAHSRGKVKLEDELYSLAKKLDLDVSIYHGGGKRDKLSGQYLQAIVDLYQEDYEHIVAFYDKYQKFNFELDNLSFDIAYYLFFKTIFTQIKSKNLPLHMVRFNQDYEISFKNVYDITLINKTDKIVPNDVNLTNYQFLELITGVNSGGKTSYIRSLGINYIFAILTGYAICDKANIYPVKHILTHFPNDENFKIGFGRLSDELSRLNKMSEYYSQDTLIILNETFSSTDETTAFELTKDLINKLNETQTYCLYVTHQQKIFDWELPLSVKVLSPMIDVNDNNKRLYKLKVISDRTSSYTYDILYKYGLTKDQLDKRQGGKND